MTCRTDFAIDEAAHLQGEGVAELTLAHTGWTYELSDGGRRDSNAQGIIQRLVKTTTAFRRKRTIDLRSLAADRPGS